MRRMSALSCCSKVPLSGRLTQFHEVSKVSHSPRWCTLICSMVWMSDKASYRSGGSCLGGPDLRQEPLFCFEDRECLWPEMTLRYPTSRMKVFVCTHTCTCTHTHTFGLLHAHAHAHGQAHAHAHMITSSIICRQFHTACTHARTRMRTQACIIYIQARIVKHALYMLKLAI